MATKTLGKVAITFGGDYSAQTVYARLTAVIGTDGQCYVTKVDNVVGISPGVTSGWGTYWALFSKRGPAGPMPNVSVGTVTTLAAGQPATVTQSGTDEEPVLNFGIPKGDPGDVQTVDSIAPNNAGNVSLGAVRYGTAQSLTDTQKAQARTNIGATSASDVDTKVSGSVKATEAQTFTNAQKTQARTNIGAAATASYTATLTVAGWTGTAAPYTQEATVAGILASDTPFVDVDMSGLTSADGMTAAQDAFGLILKATAGAGKITFAASDKPDVALTVKIKVVR